ncbi:shikimate transporter [compost metagenome]
MSDLFPVRVRYSGLALGHEVGSIFSGGLGPMLAVALLMEFNASWPVSVLLMVYALLAWIALRSLPNNKKEAQE